MQECNVDVVVVGQGGAGLRAALAAHGHGAKTAIVYIGPGATPQITAFNVPIGAADPRDNPRVYYEDMLRAGGGINQPELAWSLASGAMELVKDLEEFGFYVAKSPAGICLQRHLGGSLYPRSVFLADRTGREAAKRMADSLHQQGITALPNIRAIVLVKLGERVIGLVGVEQTTGELFFIRSKAVVLACGGVGHLYHPTTYPWDVRGDSYQLALTAGAELVDMEFVQYEPTVCFTHEPIAGMEMPTAMFGDGAVLRNARGERFLLRDNPNNEERGMEKARMSLYMDREIKAGLGSPNGGLYFDATALAPAVLQKYPEHCNRLREVGLEPGNDFIEVKPVAHSQMGGIKIDADCYTSVPGLYAAGEAAGGVHGASRMAGNSGSDIFFFGKIAGCAAAKYALEQASEITSHEWSSSAQHALELLKESALTLSKGNIDCMPAIRAVMTAYVGLTRNAVGLETALEAIGSFAKGPDQQLRDDAYQTYADLVGTMLLSQIIAQTALMREESRGAHFREDYPHRQDGWQRNIYSRLRADGTLAYQVGNIIAD